MRYDEIWCTYRHASDYMQKQRQNAEIDTDSFPAEATFHIFRQCIDLWKNISYKRESEDSQMTFFWIPFL